jgi:hypothetical protein
MKKEKLTPLPRKRKRPAESENGNAEAAKEGKIPDLSHIAPDLHPLAVPIADLEFLRDNPMDHDDRSIEEMREELRTDGQVSPLIVNVRARPWVVISGNRRLKAMLAEGWQFAAIVKLDLSDEQAAKLSVVLNGLQDTTYNPANLQKALHAVGQLPVGEMVSGLLSRLAEAHKLIPADGRPRHQPGPLDNSDGRRAVVCPSCGHQFEVT